jgi:hypothetical protein
LIAKLFDPCRSATWYLTEYNPTQKIAFGYPGSATPDIAYRKKAVPLVLKTSKDVPENIMIKRFEETKVTTYRIKKAVWFLDSFPYWSFMTSFKKSKTGYLYIIRIYLPSIKI